MRPFDAFQLQLCLILLLGCVGMAHAEEPEGRPVPLTASQLEKKIHQLEKQLQRLERKRKAAGALARKTTSSAPGTRFQMLKAGRRVVVLDTETGETKVIEPEANAPLQHVEVGKALVVVTVLGRVNQNSAAENDRTLKTPAESP